MAVNKNFKLVFVDGRFQGIDALNIDFDYIMDSLYPNVDLNSRMLYLSDSNIGISKLLKEIESLISAPDLNVCYVTNSVELLNYVPFNEDTKSFPIWLWNNKENKLFHINNCTPKELRFCHNLTQLYLNGAFGNDVYISTQKK
jgi:hypothetical protein